MSWEIKNWRENTGQTKVKGWFTVVYGDIEINNFSFVSGEEGDFISFPSTPYEKDGETKYQLNAFIPDKQRRYAFMDWAQGELEKIVGVEPEPVDGSGKNIPF